MEQLWHQYVFGKQTFRELAHTYDSDRRTLRVWLEEYIPSAKQHHPRPVHLFVDATYFGERTARTSWCVVVFKDAATSEDLWWQFASTETTSVYHAGRMALEQLGYQILSVTGDGFSGIRAAFYGIPYQMCQVHMERLVIQGTTHKPKLEAGIVLLALVRTIHNSNQQIFMHRLYQYMDKYRTFLNHKSVTPITGETFWTHEQLRRAVMSLERLAPYCFTFERNTNIPKTTNALEGHFGHLNEIVSIHRGLSRKQKEKVIHTILLASTIAPKEQSCFK